MRLRFDRSQSEAEVELRFESSSAARWMPRTIAGGVIAVATVWALDITAVQRSGVMLRGLALAIGAYFALWALRTGSEVLTRVRLEGDRLWLDAPGRTRELRYAAIERVGWDAPVGPRGSKLSGGERQRVAIARALLSRVCRLCSSIRRSCKALRCTPENCLKG